MPPSLSAGRTLSHYRILSHLGSGGMGDVYLAEDQRLGRRLALKVLSALRVTDEDRVRRFEQEARAVSALNHPNILTLYDVGHADDVHFIATEYVDGDTLRARLAHGPLTRSAACDIAIQVGAALSAAHASGIVHRDIKPENVMVRRDGYVKVLDFGLAKLSAEADPATAAEAETQRPGATSPGMILGTVKYMSPEQARGLPVDARSDVFALGVLLYEMLTGRPPFNGPTPADVIAALVHLPQRPLCDTAGAAAASPDLAAMDRVLDRALYKEREARYPSIDALLSGLQMAMQVATAANTPAHAVAATVSPGQLGAIASHAIAVASATGTRKRRKRQIDSIAVLPITNATRDEDLEYLSDGLTETLINNLSLMPKLRVMARSTMYRYKGRDIDPLQVGRDLGVRAVLIGRLAAAQGRCRISAELVDVDDGSQIWNAQFDRQRDDLVAVDSEIARELGDALHLRLTSGQRNRLQRPVASNAAAYDLYLKGRYHWNKRSPDALKRAVALFQDAVALDPTFALGYVGLADSYSLMASGYTAVSVANATDGAREAAERALALDETLAEAHAALAFIKFRFDWDFVGAELEFRRALDLGPGLAAVRQRYAMFLSTRSRFDEALAEISRAKALDPLSSAVQSAEGRILHFALRYDEAIAVFQRILRGDPQFASTRMDLSLAWIAKEDFGEAEAELNRTAGIIGETATIILFRAYCAMRQGRHDAVVGAQKTLEEKYANGAATADELAMIALWLGNRQRGATLLEEGCQRRGPVLSYVNVEPIARALIDDPDCREILRRYGLTT